MIMLKNTPVPTSTCSQSPIDPALADACVRQYNAVQVGCDWTCCIMIVSFQCPDVVRWRGELNER